MDVSCSIVGGEPTVFIAHDPEGYPGLTAAARAIRLEKARVPSRRLCRVAGIERDVGARTPSLPFP
jgi:hypothetical protein